MPRKVERSPLTLRELRELPDWLQVRTVGDLWKAMSVLDRMLALCNAEGGDCEEAVRKLIARVALATGVERREIVNMPLARFVENAGQKCIK